MAKEEHMAGEEAAGQHQVTSERRLRRIPSEATAITHVADAGSLKQGRKGRCWDYNLHAWKEEH